MSKSCTNVVARHHCLANRSQPTRADNHMMGRRAVGGFWHVCGVERMRCTSAMSISEQSSESKTAGAILQYPMAFIIRIMELLQRALGLSCSICGRHLQNLQRLRKARCSVFDTSITSWIASSKWSRCHRTERAFSGILLWPSRSRLPNHVLYSIHCPERLALAAINLHKQSTANVISMSHSVICPWV